MNLFCRIRNVQEVNVNGAVIYGYVIEKYLRYWYTVKQWLCRKTKPLLNNFVVGVKLNDVNLLPLFCELIHQSCTRQFDYARKTKGINIGSFRKL